MELNYLAIVIATILQFIVGAVWYTAIFGKLWGKMHNFDQYSKEEQQQMMKKMGPFYVLQFVVTFVTTWVLALIISNLSSEWNAFGAAGWLWLGFVLPTQMSAVVFGGTEARWMVKKIAVASGGSLACLMVAAAVLYFI